MEYLSLYDSHQARRHNVLPGMTGWAQVNGRNAISWEQRFELDLYYVENRNLLLDMYILLLTVWNVLARKGITPPDSDMMKEFRGNTSSEDISCHEG
jgi:lipopolysaccharide/colanic/teichoic acid biosynthesis glycosyltransferase